MGVDKELDGSDIRKVKSCLDFIIDEPSVFYIKEKDSITRSFMDVIHPTYKLISLKELKQKSPRSTKVIFVMKSVNRKVRKIIEIICKDLFNYSVIFI